MPPIRARTAAGAEFSFPTRSHFAQAVARGRVTMDWEVYHARARCWLPVTLHPAFSAQPPAAPAGAPPSNGRSPDLVLIYPDLVPSADTVAAPAAESDPFDGGPILTPDEIQRVLHTPRRNEPATQAAVPDQAAGPRPAESASADDLFHKALRTLPTFSRALVVAAELVNVRLA